MQTTDMATGLIAFVLWGGIVVIAVMPFILIFRRTGRSGWWGLLMLVPLLNLVVLWSLALGRWPAFEDGSG